MDTNALERLPKLSSLLTRMMLVRLVFNVNIVSVRGDSFIARIGASTSNPIPSTTPKKEIKAEFRKLIKQSTLSS
jgi:hypothetical protein